MTAAVSGFGNIPHPSGVNFGESIASFENSSRAVESVMRSVETLQKASKEILRQMVSMSAATAQAALDAMKAIWNLLVRIARALFGVLKPGAKHAEKDDADADVKSIDKAKNPATSQGFVDSAVGTVTAMVAENTDNSVESKAFLDALRYAGLDGFAVRMANLARDPAEYLKDGGADLLTNSLIHSMQAFEGLEPKVFAARDDREKAAAVLSKKMVPPLRVETLIDLYRKLSESGEVPELQKPHVDAMLAADDSLKMLVAHKNAIAEGVTLMAASAEKGGVDISLHTSTLITLIGDDWRDRIEDSSHMLVALAASKPLPSMQQVNAVSSEAPVPAKPESAAAKNLRASILNAMRVGGFEEIEAHSKSIQFGEQNEEKGEKPTL